jgi:hypothetical protein
MWSPPSLRHGRATDLPRPCSPTTAPSSAAGRARGRVLLESEIERLGIVCKHSTPYHPQTCGKVERFHQTSSATWPNKHRHLAGGAPTPTRHLPRLLHQQSPHRALNGATPLVAFNDRLKAHPSQPPSTTHFRVRQDRTDTNGTVTRPYLSRLRHIALGRVHKYERVTLVVAGRQVRVVGTDGSLIRELTIDPERSHQALGTPGATLDWATMT